jgi:hypothetical protein
MIASAMHREIHSKLMQRKSPTLLWGSPFDNAWIGFVLNDHKDKDVAILSEILNFCERWIRSTDISDILKEERNIGALSLYAGIMFNLRDKKGAEQIQNSIKKKIIELDKKEKGKFSLFNSPEIFYSTVAGLAMSGMLEEEQRKILLKYALNEVENRWHDKIYRFALYSAALFELKAEDTTIDKIANFLASIDIKELSVDEVIPLLWFIIKYGEDIFKRLKGDELRKVIKDIKEKLWNQFEDQYTYLSYEFQVPLEDTEIETGTVYSLSTFELGIIDDLLVCQEKVYEADLSIILDLSQLHSILDEWGLSTNWAIGASALALIEVMVNKKLEELKLRKDGDFRTRYNRLLSKAKEKGIQLPDLLADPFYQARNKLLHGGKEPTAEELKLILEYLNTLSASLKKIRL